MPKLKHHILICHNTRPKDNPKPCCNPENTFRMQELFKKAIADHGLAGDVRATKTGCLGQCEHGPTVVIYPDAIWYGWVRESDVNAIVEAVKNGGIVEKNLLPDECINTKTCVHRPQNSTSDKTK
jgi:(2Fe-2S) ferredoxin